MNDFLCKIIALIIVFLFLAVFLFALDWITSAPTCRAKARVLGYTSTYGPFQGCVLERPDGKKVLLEQLRDFNIGEI